MRKGGGILRAVEVQSQRARADGAREWAKEKTRSAARFVGDHLTVFAAGAALTAGGLYMRRRSRSGVRVVWGWSTSLSAPAGLVRHAHVLLSFAKRDAEHASAGLDVYFVEQTSNERSNQTPRVFFHITDEHKLGDVGRCKHFFKDKRGLLVLVINSTDPQRAEQLRASVPQDLTGRTTEVVVCGFSEFASQTIILNAESTKDARSALVRLMRGDDGVAARAESESGLPATGVAEGSTVLFGLEQMRAMDTTDLLRMFSSAERERKTALAEFCVCRVHDVRDLLLHHEHKTAAKEVLEFHANRLEATERSERSECQKAQLWFLKKALTDSDTVARQENVYGHNWGPGTMPIPRHRKLSDIVGDVEDDGNHATHGPIATWDVRGVEDMASAFSSATRERNTHLRLAYFEDLSFWDTRSASDMSHMFEGLVGDVKVGTWDTRNVIDMSEMFASAASFNGNISGWDVGNVRLMQNMFHGASAFKQDLSGWRPRITNPNNMTIRGSAMSESQMPRLLTAFGYRQGRRSYV